jgi:aldehyde dehydrogenase (NAD+)
MKSILNKLDLYPEEMGAGTGTWEKCDGEILNSFTPITGKTIAKIQCADEKNYNHIVEKSIEAFQSWRQVPAPKRGEIVRQMGNALRENKEALGALITLEVGKIRAEGEGEVQEMIDMADFAVGQSRMLYGMTMQSERPKHRMYEQWLPLGPVGVITAFNFPAAVWAWNAMLALIAGDTVIWKPSSKAPLTAIAVMKILWKCSKIMTFLKAF